MAQMADPHRRLLHPNLHQHERSHVLARRGHRIQTLRRERAGGSNPPDDLPDCVRICVRVLGPLERGVWALAGAAVESVFDQCVADPLRAGAELCDVCGLPDVGGTVDGWWVSDTRGIGGYVGAG